MTGDNRDSMKSDWARRDHKHFLRGDCANINDFFRRSGSANVLTVRELFDFVVGEHIGSNRDEEEGALSYLLDSAGSRDMESMRLSQRDDDVFMRSYIPRTLQIEIRENQFQGHDEHIEQSLFARLTGLSIVQKRERAPSRSKSTSLLEGSHVGTSEIIPFKDVRGFLQTSWKHQIWQHLAWNLRRSERCRRRRRSSACVHPHFAFLMKAQGEPGDDLTRQFDSQVAEH